MFRYSRLSGKKVLAMVITMTVLGLAFMIIINARFGGTETKEDAAYKAPGAGMASVMEGYLASTGESSVDMLTSTAVAAGNGNRYYDESGSNVGKLIVCTADDFAPVYLIKDDTSGMYGKIYKDSVATLITENDGEWVKVVSGSVTGYVKAEDFAFGEAAESLDSRTYVTTATIDSDELTLRESEDMTSVAKCILSPDAQYEVVKEDEGSGWTKLNVAGVGEGYVLTEYIAVNSAQKVGVTLDQEYMTENTIMGGVEEAEAREAMWTANRLAAEAAAEAERLATEEAIAEYNRLAAEAAAIQAAYEASYTASYSETDYSYDDGTMALMSNDDWTTDISSDYSEGYDDGTSYDDSADYSFNTDESYDYDWSEYSEDSNDYADDSWMYEDWSDDGADDSWSDSSEDYYEETYYEEEYSEEYYEEEVYVDTASDLRSQVVSYARSFCGWLPYVSGGHSLSTGADCSGFTSAIYAAFGYAITPSSVGQQYVGRSVSLSEALPGDIIIYNYGQHVAIYSGGGMKIHSPYPGEVVSEGSIYTGNITDIRRIIE